MTEVPQYALLAGFDVLSDQFAGKLYISFLYSI
jgi:hypothetical protein